MLSVAKWKNVVLDGFGNKSKLGKYDIKCDCDSVSALKIRGFVGIIAMV